MDPDSVHLTEAPTIDDTKIECLMFFNRGVRP